MWIKYSHTTVISAPAKPRILERPLLHCSAAFPAPSPVACFVFLSTVVRGIGMQMVRRMVRVHTFLQSSEGRFLHASHVVSTKHQPIGFITKATRVANSTLTKHATTFFCTMHPFCTHSCSYILTVP